MTMNQKMSRWTIALVLLLALLPGCDGMLTEEPQDVLTPENFFQSERDAQSGVLSIYQPLTQRQAFENYMYAVNDIASDVGRVGRTATNASNLELTSLDFTSVNKRVTDPWEQFYQSLTRANLVIDRVPEIEMDEGLKTELVAEAKFMRALDYFFLVRLYGDVPLVTSSSSLAQDVARSPSEEVYQQIITDAQEATQALPLEREDADQGRATRGAALHLLAKVHLTRENWSEAANYAKQVMDTGNYSLFDDYLHAFLPQYENGREHIFSLQFGGRNVGQGAHHVAMYYPRQIGVRRGGGWGFSQPTDWHYNSYISGDYRHEVTFRSHWTNLEDEEFDLNPHVFKYRPSQVTAISGGDTNVPTFRYAETLLIYAEALNEMGRSEEAVQYVNRVRERARNGDGSGTASEQPANYTGPFGQDTVRAVIFQERRWELAYECKRWFDLVRRGEEYFTSELEAHDPFATNLESTDMRWPVPQSELDVNPSLTQNDGY